MLHVSFRELYQISNSFYSDLVVDNIPKDSVQLEILPPVFYCKFAKHCLILTPELNKNRLDMF